MARFLFAHWELGHRIKAQNRLHPTEKQQVGDVLCFPPRSLIGDLPIVVGVGRNVVDVGNALVTQEPKFLWAVGPVHQCVGSGLQEFDGTTFCWVLLGLMQLSELVFDDELSMCFLDCLRLLTFGIVSSQSVGDSMLPEKILADMWEFRLCFRSSNVDCLGSASMEHL